MMMMILNNNEIMSPTAANNTGDVRSHTGIAMLSLLTHYQSIYMGTFRNKIISVFYYHLSDIWKLEQSPSGTDHG